MRATIRDGELTLVPGRLATVSGGPIGCLARAALPPDATVADLRFGVESEDAADESDEADGGEVPDEADEADDGGGAEVDDRTVEVRFLANDGADARRELKRWAARTGHERIWFRDEVCELEPPAAIDREHSTTCPSCGLEITDSGPELMGFVRKVGHSRSTASSAARSSPSGGRAATPTAPTTPSATGSRSPIPTSTWSAGARTATVEGGVSDGHGGGSLRRTDSVAMGQTAFVRRGARRKRGR